MSEIVVTDLHAKERSSRARATKVPTRRVRSVDGKPETRYVLDTLSPNFEDQFLKVFQLNVARARREAGDLAKKLGVAAE